MTLILNNDDVRKSLNVKECLNVMEESYREQASGRAVNRPTSQSYLPHSIPQSTYNFKSVDGGVGKYGVLALRVTSTSTRSSMLTTPFVLKNCRSAKGMFVGLVQLFSAETGELLAIMPDGSIQQTRVAVTSALGVKVMARENSKFLGSDRFWRPGPCAFSFPDGGATNQARQDLQSQSRAPQCFR